MMRVRCICEENNPETCYMLCSFLCATGRQNFDNTFMAPDHTSRDGSHTPDLYYKLSLSLSLSLSLCLSEEECKSEMLEMQCVNNQRDAQFL